MSKVFAVTNQKGGVGKTTTTINLAASLALADQNVLIVDMDPQANLTSGIGRKGSFNPAGTVYEALTAATTININDFVVSTEVAGLSLLPADNNLTGAEVELVSLDARERRLRPLLQQAEAEFDYVFIDTPPSLGFLTLNALVAAEAVIIPLTCEYFALEGLAELMTTLRRVQGTFNPKLEIAGVLLTMADNRTNLGQQVAKEVRDFFGDKVFGTYIPRNIRLAEAPSYGLPAILHDVRSKGAEAYLALAREFISREQCHREREM
ncbi:MAG: ParA family protein [Acidobacteriota bacterium]|nr:ParA family protein [Acidobacteriota bacterium]